MAYTKILDPLTGKLSGISNGVSTIPIDPMNSDYQRFLIAQQSNPIDISDGSPTARRKRRLIDIYNDLNALSTQQKLNIASDLFAGSPMKVLTTSGDAAYSLSVLHEMTTLTNLTAGEKNEVRLRAAAAYVRDNPTYCVNPSFDNTINVPGDELV